MAFSPTLSCSIVDHIDASFNTRLEGVGLLVTARQAAKPAAKKLTAGCRRGGNQMRRAALERQNHAT
jgi:hypothetical protein